ncbi:hypothetical protein AB0C59_33230 [Streptomyces sp. NPDC048664]|uniref:hypothetical protein n=1 Tax=Streptomyces sp. NPDC048664 TaxID=3154505 RepID=UPI0034133CE6
MARKTLVFAADGQPAHRACQSATDRSPTRSAAPPGLTRAPKDISRAELLKKVEALRKHDAKMKPGAAKAQPADRPSSRQRHTAASGRSPQPFYGVEMKFIQGCLTSGS